LGWAIGRNTRIDVRWASAHASEIRRHAAELVALKPDVILATGESTMPPLLQATRIVLIVFPELRSGSKRLRQQPSSSWRHTDYGNDAPKAK
jgi:hypothetical protein